MSVFFKPRLTPTQAADADSFALRDVEQHDGLDGSWARPSKRILDLLDTVSDMTAKLDRMKEVRVDLLAACEAMLAAFGNCGSPRQQAAADAARAAIAKAKGGE